MNLSLIHQLLTSGVKSIRVGNIIFFLRMGKVCQRVLNGANSGKNWKRTEKRVESNEQFAGDRRMSSHMKDAYATLPVWQHAAAYRTGNTKTSDSYRHRVNHGFITPQGEVKDFKHFVVSDGALLLPLHMSMTRKNNAITLTWDNQSHSASARATDIIHVIAIGSTRPDALMLLHGPVVTRAEGTATFEVEAEKGEILHVYPFFGNAENNAFSPNEYFEALANIEVSA